MRFIADYLPHCVGRFSLIPRGRGLVDAARWSVNDEVEAGDRRRAEICWLHRFSRWKIKEQSVSQGGKVNCLQLLPSQFLSIHLPSPFEIFRNAPFRDANSSSEDNRTRCQLERVTLPTGWI